MEAERIVHQIMNQHIKHDINRKKSTKVKFCGYDRKTFDLQLQIKRSILRLALYYVFILNALKYIIRAKRVAISAIQYTYIEKS